MSRFAILIPEKAKRTGDPIPEDGISARKEMSMDVPEEHNPVIRVLKIDVSGQSTPSISSIPEAASARHSWDVLSQHAD
jgi:hypothetical protein